MAQENSPDKGKRQGRTKKPEKPYVEQIDELLLVHNKNDPKEGLGVVSKADEKGNYQTVVPEEKNENFGSGQQGRRERQLSDGYTGREE